MLFLLAYSYVDYTLKSKKIHQKEKSPKDLMNRFLFLLNSNTSQRPDVPQNYKH